MSYRGRFAPTTSGPLHAGSLLCALASWLRAHAAGGRWLLRIDDLDIDRCKPEFADTIQRQLEAHGLTWDEPASFQSHHVEEYRAALETLRAHRQLYACCCSRARLALESQLGIDGPVYAATCRNENFPVTQFALRVRVADETLRIDDLCQGALIRDAQSDIGDFVVQRSDGQIAYQLASVIDEAAQGITEIVRGSDLIGSSFRQLLLRNRLDLPQPDHFHIPILVESSGRKLSKQNHAREIDNHCAVENLFHALVQLGQAPPENLRLETSVEATLHWAKTHWRAGKIPAQRELLSDA